MAGWRPYPGVAGRFRRRSHEGIAPPSPLSTKPVLRRQPRQISPRLVSVGDSNSSGDGWLSADSFSEQYPKCNAYQEKQSYLGRQCQLSTCHGPSRRVTRRHESVTFEESIPVIVRRRGCTMTVRIVSVDDIEVDDDNLDELRDDVPLSRPPHTPMLLPRGSLPSAPSSHTRSSTPSPRCSLSVLSLPQVRRCSNYNTNNHYNFLYFQQLVFVT